MPGLKPRAKTVAELAENARFYVERRPIPIDDKAKALLDEGARTRLAEIAGRLADVDWSTPALEEAVRRFAEEKGVKLGAAAQPLRAALAGSTTSPGIFDVMAVLGREETLARLADVASRP
jgi:glutamyl-tRNA synthetase